MSATVTSVGDTFLQLLNEVLLFIPKLISAAILLLIGYVVARLVRTLLTKGLRAIRFDDITDRAGVGKALKSTGTNLDAAAVLATLIYYYVFLIFIQLALNTLGLIEITTFITALLAYLPNVFVAIAILILGALLANVVGKIAQGAASEAGLSTAGLIGNVARYAIIGFAALTALTQLHVGENMVQILFSGLIAMLAIAGGLAFGLGGVESARGLLASQTMGSMLQPGQKIQIGNKSGTVVRHDLNSTVLKTTEGQVSIPNSSLSHEEITVLSA